MAVREVLPEEYDDLDQKLEKELPLSILGLVHFRLMRRKHLLTEKMVLVDSWPDFSVLAIVQRHIRETWLSVCFCKDPKFASNLETLILFASRNTYPPLYINGCTSEVMDALVSAHQSMNSCPFRRMCADLIVYTLRNKNIVPRPIPDGFQISELSEIHTDIVQKSWSYASKKKSITYQITNFQSVMIETDDGRPVAWGVQHEYGAIGMLHVEPEYRRNKLGSIVTRTLANKLIKDGQLVFALVEENNDTSIAFHENNGYVRLPFKFSCMELIFGIK
ncbi:glycine N-acyltransferase-like protein 3 isoform X3 [Crassostrea angulata]|uniref:glycine N-acyltransferase-like protein 3 isoform X3 n=1 Tax=Magallana angulata TaxID=2784310 RepID=UPI0022B10C33|nr:glycine N-acyltransferase-like protein 3 isoform X3 [Crassostrea angulata]